MKKIGVLKITKKIIKWFIPAVVIRFYDRLIMEARYRQGNKRADQQFANKSPKEVFTTIYKEKLWGVYGSDEFYSGSGSHDEERVNTYVGAVRTFLERLPSKPNVVDLGCGDFNVGKRIRGACHQYVACDVVDALIERNKVAYKELDVDFRCIDICADDLPCGDLAFIRQVLQHLSNQQILDVVSKLSIYKYLIVSEGVPVQKDFIANQDKPIGDGIRFKRSRKVNSGVVLTLPPFNLVHRTEFVLCEALEGEAVIRTTVYELQ
jgi:hypothetical protein